MNEEEKQKSAHNHAMRHIQYIHTYLVHARYTASYIMHATLLCRYCGALSSRMRFQALAAAARSSGVIASGM